MGKGTIEITRSNLRFNKFRGYSVIVDDNKVASIKNNKTISLSVDPGFKIGTHPIFIDIKDYNR